MFPNKLKYKTLLFIAILTCLFPGVYSVYACDQGDNSRKRDRDDEEELKNNNEIKEISNKRLRKNLNEEDEQQPELPPELEERILSFLGKRDLLISSKVCSRWRDITYVVGKRKIIELDKSNIPLTQENCKYITQLKFPFSSLILQSCGLSAIQVAVLMTGTFTLTSLDLSNNNIDNLGTAALGNPTSLTSLNLSNNNISEMGARILLVRNLSALVSLDLSDNNINGSVEGLRNFTSLTELNLSYNEVDGAVGELIGFTSLISLNLSSTNTSNDEVKKLANGNFHTLEFLGLSEIDINNDVIQTLANGSLTRLTRLNLGNNESIDDTGLQAFTTGNLTALTHLDLFDNNIGDTGAQELANGNLPALTYLDLENTSVGTIGAEALINKFSHLTYLNLKNDDEIIISEDQNRLKSMNLSLQIEFE